MSATQPVTNPLLQPGGIDTDTDTNTLLRQSREVLYDMNTQTANQVINIAELEQIAMNRNIPQTSLNLPQGHSQPCQQNINTSEERRRQNMYGGAHNELSGLNPSETPPWVSVIINSLDGRLRNIEAQITTQNSKWQNIEGQLQNQNQRMVNIEQQMSQMNSLKQNFTQIQLKVSNIESELKTVTKEVAEHDKGLEYCSNLCDDFITEKSDVLNSVAELGERLSKLEGKQKELEIKQADLKSKQTSSEEKITDVQWRSMRENLIFTGIEETRGSSENTESTLRGFLSSKMNINEPIPFDRVHRLGQTKPPQHGQQTRPRPIIAKFERFRDKERVRMAAPIALENTEFGVREQFPIEIENRRRLLYPAMRYYKKDKQNKVRLVRDKLYINDIEYIPEDDANTTQNKRHTTDMNVQRRTYNHQTDRQMSTSQRNNQRSNHGYPQNKTIYSQRIFRPSYSATLLNNGARPKQRTSNISQRGTNSEIQTSNRFTNFSDGDDMDIDLTFDSQSKYTTGKQQASSPLENDGAAKKQRQKSPSQNVGEATSTPLHTDKTDLRQPRQNSIQEVPPLSVSSRQLATEINISPQYDKTETVNLVVGPIHINSLTSNGSPINGVNSREAPESRTSNVQ